MSRIKYNNYWQEESDRPIYTQLVEKFWTQIVSSELKKEKKYNL